jgi:adenosylcobinamide-GDP ribazoletransferase
MDPRFAPQRLAADAAACLGFFTRLPAGRFGLPEVDFASAMWAAPIAGAVVGVCAGAAFAVGRWLTLPPSLAAVATLAVVLVVTGSLHEDGVADVADAFGGGHTRERKLEILKDSRNGTFAVVALVMTLLARWAAMATLGGSSFALLSLIAVHAASRALIPGFMNLVAPARPTGLAASIGKVPGNVALAAAGLGVLALVPLGLATAFTALICLLVLFIGLKWLTENQIGGQTGDVLGTLQQGGEIVILFVIAARYSL